MKNTGDYENIDNVNRLYFVTGKVDGYIGESNGNKYLEINICFHKIHRTLKWD